MLRLSVVNVTVCNVVVNFVLGFLALNQYSRRKSQLRHSIGDKVDLGEWPHYVLIVRLFDRRRMLYRCFCGGTIIGENRLLSSSNCFISNKKRFRHNMNQVRFAAGLLKTVEKEPEADDIQQWRTMEHLYSQRFYRYPAFNLAIVITSKPWVFNLYVNKIPYGSLWQDYDGFCTDTAVKATRAWSEVKYIHTEEVQIIPRDDCEKLLCRSCKQFMCTVYDTSNKYAYSETEGGGLICYDTGDPKEVDPDQGVLVAVTTCVHIGLPNLQMRVGNFEQWIDDESCSITINNIVMCVCLLKLVVF